MVLSVDKREDSVAYKSATSRIAQKANLMATALKRKAVKQTLS
ncbi:MAG: hypothetical protein JWP52_1346 [Rhizobacter sp.]|nr:hypothetical protein [Rhizobacter sp.]